MKGLQLNTNQQAAVSWSGGPLLVLAGPGSGKTQVLTLRCAEVLQASEDSSVLALTFTDKAAGEMRQRLEALLGGPTDRARLTTFHSYAAALLRQHGVHLGLRPDFVVVAQPADRKELLSEVIAASGRSDVPGDHGQVLELLEKLSHDATELTDALSDRPPWVGPVYAAYYLRQRETSRLDYDAIIHFARQLLSDFAGIARVERLTWSHVSVDEFQDTNRAQYLLLKALVGTERPNLFVVGDEDQILYQWNGASTARMNDLVKDFKVDILQLPENYRCPPVIVEKANTLIAHNRGRFAKKKPLVAAKAPEPVAEVIRYAVLADEAAEARHIGAEIRARGLISSECVVLARASKQLKVICAVLESLGIKSHLAERKTAFVSNDVRLAYDLVRLASGRHDRDLLRRVCVAWTQRAGSLLEAEEVASVAAADGGDFFRAFLDAAPMDPITDAARTWLLDAVQPTAYLDAISKVLLGPTPAEQTSGSDPMTAEELATWQELHDDVMAQRRSGDPPIHTYVQELEMRSKAPTPPPNVVRLMTVHGAKGLEFPHVFVAGLADEVFPSYFAIQRGDMSREVEEERRSCFVAITRTRTSLTLTRAQRYGGWNKGPSRFLREMGFEQ